jgi:transposase
MEDSGHIPEWTGQRVVRTNARGRNSYCEPFKAWLVGQARKPGMSMAGLAMRNQVNANLLRRWVQMRRGDADMVVVPRLLAVTVAPEPVKAAALIAPSLRIEIELGGAVVRVGSGVDAEVLRTVIDALRGTAR